MTFSMIIGVCIGAIIVLIGASDPHRKRGVVIDSPPALESALRDVIANGGTIYCDAPSEREPGVFDCRPMALRDMAPSLRGAAREAMSPFALDIDCVTANGVVMCSPESPEWQVSYRGSAVAFTMHVEHPAAQATFAPPVSIDGAWGNTPRHRCADGTWLALGSCPEDVRK